MYSCDCQISHRGRKKPEKADDGGLKVWPHGKEKGEGRREKGGNIRGRNNNHTVVQYGPAPDGADTASDLKKTKLRSQRLGYRFSSLLLKYNPPRIFGTIDISCVC